uniref:Geminin n=1 Tax=Angiostrongylus cantonensis TaxID=6313 RepID=A0A0K0DBR9_ANGCA
MANIRIGLKQVSNSNASPSLSILHTKKVSTGQAGFPIKERSELTNKVNALSTVDNKENQAVQVSVEVESSYAQTDVITTRQIPSISKEDLLCEDVTSSYWRGIAERFEKEIDSELETSFNTSLELDKSYEDLAKSESRLKILMEVLDDIVNDEKNDKEEAAIA